MPGFASVPYPTLPYPSGTVGKARSRKTNISMNVADQVLLHIYKNYFIPILLEKNIKAIPTEFQDVYLINKTLNKKQDNLNLLDSEKSNFLKEQLNYIEKDSNRNSFYETVSIIFKNLITDIRRRKFENGNVMEIEKIEITFNDFVDEVCYYSQINSKVFKLKDSDIQLERNMPMKIF